MTNLSVPAIYFIHMSNGADTNAIMMMEFTNPEFADSDDYTKRTPDVIVVPITDFSMGDFVDLKNSPMDGWYESVRSHNLLAATPLSSLMDASQMDPHEDDMLVDEIVDAGVCTKVSLCVQDLPSVKNGMKRKTVDERVYTLVFPEPSQKDLYGILGFEN